MIASGKNLIEKCSLFDTIVLLSSPWRRSRDFSSSFFFIFGYVEKGEGGGSGESWRFFEMTRSDNPTELWEKMKSVNNDMHGLRNGTIVENSVRGELELP